MNIEEFSDEFDVLFDSWSSKTPIGEVSGLPVCDEYEKSVYLTQAQQELVINIYNGNLGSAFEETEENTVYLAPLIRQVCFKNDVYAPVVTSYSTSYELPEDVWFKIYEKAIISDPSLRCNNCDKREVDVVPVTHDTFFRTKNSPFRGTTKRRVLRLTNGPNLVELVSKYPIVSYTVRYLVKPEPIILQDLPEHLNIEGETKKQTCLLGEPLHRKILERAVQIALSIKYRLNNSNNNQSN